MHRRQSRLRDREWQLDREKVQIESRCQIKLHQADETIKTWKREARARIAAWGAAVERQRQMLEEEIACQRQKANERQENLDKRKGKLGDREKECEFRVARLNQRQVELEVMTLELRHWEQNLHGWEQDLDERERGLRDKEPMEIPEETSEPGGQICKTGRDDDNQNAQVKSLEEKIWKILSVRGEMKKRDLELKLNKSRHDQYWETAISNLLASGKIIYDADSNTYRCQHELFQ